MYQVNICRNPVPVPRSCSWFNKINNRSPISLQSMTMIRVQQMKKNYTGEDCVKQLEKFLSLVLRRIELHQSSISELDMVQFEKSSIYYPTENKLGDDRRPTPTRKCVTTWGFHKINHERLISCENGFFAKRLQHAKTGFLIFRESIRSKSEKSFVFKHHFNTTSTIIGF